MRVDTNKIGKGELLSLSDAAKIIGCNYEKLRRARNDGRLVVLATNEKMTTGGQLIRYIEDPRSVKASSQIKGKKAAPGAVAPGAQVGTTHDSNTRNTHEDQSKRPAPGVRHG